MTAAVGCDLPAPAAANVCRIAETTKGPGSSSEAPYVFHLTGLPVGKSPSRLGNGPPRSPSMRASSAANALSANAARVSL